MVRGEELEEMKCFCGQLKNKQMDGLEEQWICPQCLIKEPPITHKTTLSKV